MAKFKVRGMGRASHALKKVLETFSISQNRLAVTLGIDRSAVFKWFHEQREPTSETIVEITLALKQLNPEAARQFVQFYLGELLEDGVGKLEESSAEIVGEPQIETDERFPAEIVKEPQIETDGRSLEEIAREPQTGTAEEPLADAMRVSEDGVVQDSLNGVLGEEQTD